LLSLACTAIACRACLGASFLQQPVLKVVQVRYTQTNPEGTLPCEFLTFCWFGKKATGKNAEIQENEDQRCQ
jgi:hypothetical protein